MKHVYLLSLLLLILVAACSPDTSTDHSQSVIVPDTLFIDQFSEIISTESELLAMPYGMVKVNDDSFAILDATLHRIMLFNYDGEKLFEFGGQGGGPGEWDMFPSGLNFNDGIFSIFSSGSFFFNLYDETGEFLSSAPAKNYMSTSQFRLMPDKHLLVNTNGREEALAVVLDLANDSNILHKIGTPTGDLTDMRDLEGERQALADGNIPVYSMNNAFVEYDKNGYWLFMRGLGELRYYSKDGELQISTKIPESIKTPIFDYVVKMNREDARPHTVFNLSYALTFRKFEDSIYVLTPAFPELDEIDQHLLVYSTEGELTQHYVIKKDDQESMIYEFFVTDDERLIALEVMNARVLEVKL